METIRLSVRGWFEGMRCICVFSLGGPLYLFYASIASGFYTLLTPIWFPIYVLWMWAYKDDCTNGDSK